MKDEGRTKKDLIAELHELRGRVAGLEEMERQITGIKDSQERFMKSFLQSAIPMGLTALEDGRFVEVSEAFLKLMGLRRNEVIGKTTTEIGFLTREERQKILSILHKSGRIENLELPIRLQDGEVRQGLLNTVMMTVGAEKYLLSMLNDITERKRLEEEIKRSGEKSEDMLHFLQVLFNTIPSPIFCKDIHGQYVDFNREFEEYVGMKRKDIIRKGVYDMYPKKIADKYHEMDENLFREPGRQIYEYPIIYADGKKRDVVVNKATYSDAEGRVAGIVGVMVDVTDRKRAEERVHRALREKETLLKEIHHRVKNNMQVISSLLDLQAAASMNQEVIKMAEESIKRIRSMSMIHEKLYESANLPGVHLAAYVKEFAGEIFESYKIRAGKIALVVKSEKEVLLSLERAIPCGLILSELISNVCKHAFPGDKEGKLKMLISESEAGEVEIVVRDNGVGLSDDVSISRPRTVGLHLVRGLVKNQLHGQMEVRIKGGAEFRITFPNR